MKSFFSGTSPWNGIGLLVEQNVSMYIKMPAAYREFSFGGMRF